MEWVWQVKVKANPPTIVCWRCYVVSGSDWWAVPTLRYADLMADYRRYFVAGGTYFFTLVTYRRRVLFDNDRNVQLLREAVAAVQAEARFEINAAVVLPDHMHFICSLPPGDADYSKRIGRMKVLFTKAFYANQAKPHALPTSRQKHCESDIWQRRYWEHTITDEDEFERLFDYIHFNLVKHGHATCPRAWTATSCHKWVDAGVLDPAWGCSCDQRTVNMNLNKDRKHRRRVVVSSPASGSLHPLDGGDDTGQGKDRSN